MLEGPTGIKDLFRPPGNFESGHNKTSLFSVSGVFGLNLLAARTFYCCLANDY